MYTFLFLFRIFVNVFFCQFWFKQLIIFIVILYFIVILNVKLRLIENVTLTDYFLVDMLYITLEPTLLLA